VVKFRGRSYNLLKIQGLCFTDEIFGL